MFQYVELANKTNLIDYRHGASFYEKNHDASLNVIVALRAFIFFVEKINNNREGKRTVTVNDSH